MTKRLSNVSVPVRDATPREEKIVRVISGEIGKPVSPELKNTNLSLKEENDRA